MEFYTALYKYYEAKAKTLLCHEELLSPSEEMIRAYSIKYCFVDMLLIQ